MYLLSAISIGLLGSLHCAGMCAPILVATNQGRSRKASILHHGGRILTYAILGSIAGALGATFNLMGFQQGFSLTIGVVLIVSVLVYPFIRFANGLEAKLGSIGIKLTSQLHQAGFGKPTVRFLTGMVNGILPCGLVYIGMAGAANTFTPWDGAVFMIAFGVGTIPLLLVTTQVGSLLSSSIRTRARRLIPVAVFLMGTLLLVRGLNLGVPYLSPKVSADTEQITSCES